MQYVSYVEPTICNPTQIAKVIEKFRDRENYIVMPPDETFPVNVERVTVLNGWPHDIPLRDGFAEIPVIDGLVGCDGLDQALREWRRVLIYDGLLYLIMHKVVVSSERGPMSFADFIESLYYEAKGGLIVPISELKLSLSRYFHHVTAAEHLGYLHVFAENKGGTIAPNTETRVKIVRHQQN